MAQSPRIALPALHGLTAIPPFDAWGREWTLPFPLTPGHVGWQVPAQSLRAELTQTERRLAALKAAGHRTRAAQREAERLPQALEALRRCPTCQTRHTWLRPRLHGVPVIEPVPGWADRLFGRDVLTLPSTLS